MENTSGRTSASPSAWPPNRVFTSPSSATNTLPYYSVHHAAGRYDLVFRVTDVFPPRAQDPHCYPVRITTGPDVKNDLTAVRPPLRKKPKLTSTTWEAPTRDPALHIGMRKLVGIPKTPSVPTFRLSLDVDDPNHNRPSSSAGVNQPSSPLQGTNSHPLQRSPSQKRPPASHSSYGVETTCGPPPSYSTQRTLSQDRIRSLDRNSGQRATTNATSDASPSKSNDPAPDHESVVSPLSPVKQDTSATSSTGSSGDEINTADSPSPETAGLESYLTPSSTMSQLPSMTSDAVDAPEKENSDPQRLMPTSIEEESKGSSSDERKSEDLFLHIAKADAARGGQIASKVDKRRSRISLPFFSSTRPSTGYNPSPIDGGFDTASVSGRSEALHYYSKRASLGQHLPGALSRTYTQDAQQETRSSHPADLPRRTISRRYSNANTNATAEPVRQFPRPSTARNSRLVSDSGLLDRPKVADHNATESTISTTAPSTVWDELDDLKSRIRKLELTGKLPPSSAAAMSTSERPKTATTAATTTMSSSPKSKPVVAPLQSAIEGIPSTVHPNLHEALGNAKAVVSNDVYQKLQASAHDALQLSMMMNPEGYTGTGSTIGASSVSERQVRRRTESMCRSLTELAIAMLAESKQPPQSVTRPASRDAYTASSAGFRGRRYSNEPNDRPPVTSRVQSRLESRRTSIPLGGPLNSQVTTPESAYHTPTTALPQIQTASSGRLGRTSMMRSRKTPGYLDGTTDDEEGSPSVRPASRAMTEVSTYRQAPRDRAAYSREYTAQHPMPSPVEPSNATRSPMPANMSTNLVSRRKYASPASNVGVQEKTPKTTKEPWGRITIVPAPLSSPLEAPLESQASLRPSNSRRSLGFASRISSVSSRLRAAKAERSASIREGIEPRGSRDIAPLGQELDHAVLERQRSGQGFES